MYYDDAYIQINEDNIVIKDCYLPLIHKKILFEEILSVQIRKPGLLNGSWRLWGTGFLQTWFAPDFSRPWRDAIFIIIFKAGGINIGFTTESSTDVIRILTDIGLPLEYVE